MTTDLAKKACIFCDGELKNSARVKRIASNCDLLISTDAGRHLAALGLQPGIIIGGMDSNGTDIWDDENSIVRIPCSLSKDKSDVELAVEDALEQGCREIILVAAVGGRLGRQISWPYSYS